MVTTPTLDRDPVRREIDAMLAAADAQEPWLHSLEFTTDTRMAPQLTEAWISVGREVGEFLAMLVRAAGARTVVEFGTSYGVSTVFLAAALRDLGGDGRTHGVVTTELEPAKAEAARGHLQRAGLDDLVDVRVGDARETLRELPDSVDMVLLDGWSALYLPVLRVVEPRLRAGALVVADDTSLFPGELVDYLAHVRDPARGYRSCDIAMGDRLELSQRL